MSKLDSPFILVNPDRCLGCHTCEMECAAAHTGAGSVLGAVLAGERLQPRNRVVQVGQAKLSTQCRQCEDAPCVRVCPTGATARTETYTAVDPARCIACHLCTMVCPFGAIHIAKARVDGRDKAAAHKCDLCVGRDAGPACVKGCPTRALSLRDSATVIRESAHASAKKFLEAVESQKQLIDHP